jgi:hypothetical protein
MSSSSRPMELAVSFCSFLVSSDELSVSPPEIVSPQVVVAGLVEWEGHGPCVALKLLEDAGGDAPLIYTSEGGTPPWLGPIVLEIVCDFVPGFCVGMSNVVVNCNGGDFGISILMTDEAVAHDGDGKIVQSEVDCVVEHAVARDVGAMKSSISLKVLYDDTQCTLKRKLGVKHGPEKLLEVRFVDVSAIGHRRTWADWEIC